MYIPFLLETQGLRALGWFPSVESLYTHSATQWPLTCNSQ
ncbi:Uncharacterised protein [Vibrio cholerae]|nr:Uncharacterised protein [Vibrio cholerae]